MGPKSVLETDYYLHLIPSLFPTLQLKLSNTNDNIIPEVDEVEI